MFAPILNNIGPALIERGYSGAAESTMQGARALASGIQSAGSSLGQGIGAALEGVQAKAAKYNQASGQMDAYRAYGKEVGMDTSFLNGIEEKYGKDPDKLLGALSVVGQSFGNHARDQYQKSQMEGAMNLAAKKAALRTSSTSTPMFGVSLPAGSETW